MPKRSKGKGKGPGPPKESKAPPRLPFAETEAALPEEPCAPLEGSGSKTLAEEEQQHQEKEHEPQQQQTSPNEAPLDRCAHCGTCENHAFTLLCGRCGTTKYCSKECQRAHWKSGHKGECDKLVLRSAVEAHEKAIGALKQKHAGDLVAQRNDAAASHARAMTNLNAELAAAKRQLQRQEEARRQQEITLHQQEAALEHQDEAAARQEVAAVTAGDVQLKTALIENKEHK